MVIVLSDDDSPKTLAQAGSGSSRRLAELEAPPAYGMTSEPELRRSVLEDAPLIPALGKASSKAWPRFLRALLLSLVIYVLLALLVTSFIIRGKYIPSRVRL